MIEEDPNGMGVVLLPDLERKVYAGTWHNFILRTDIPTRELAIADFDGNGIVDADDYSLLEEAIGYEGNSKYDIARRKDPLAEPDTPDYGQTVIGQGGDYIVDELDKTAFNELKIADEKRRGVYTSDPVIGPGPEGSDTATDPPSVWEGFESGQFGGSGWVNYGAWSVTSEKAHSGTYSAQCAEGGGALKWSGFLPAGECSFWAYIGAAGRLEFSVNGIVQWERAGGQAWEQVVVAVKMGTNNLRWEGRGPLFIDDVCVPQP